MAIKLYLDLVFSEQFTSSELNVNTQSLAQAYYQPGQREAGHNFFCRGAAQTCRWLGECHVPFPVRPLLLLNWGNTTWACEQVITSLSVLVLSLACTGPRNILKGHKPFGVSEIVHNRA